MATAPLPDPTLGERFKKRLNYLLGTVGHALGSPVVAEEIELEPAPTDADGPVPVNAFMVPSVFLDGFAEVFASIQPSLRQVVYRVHNVNVAWHGSVVKGLRVFVPSLPKAQMEMELAGTFLLRQLRSKTPTELVGKPVGLAFDSWSGNYFHWIAEVLTRLVLLSKVQPDCVILLPGPKPPDYITQTVAALGFRNTKVVLLGELVKIPDLWIAGRPGQHGYMVPQLTCEVREKVINSLSPGFDKAKQASRRVYVSRSRQKWRQLTNEVEVVALLERYGFETVYFEDMTFVEQVRTMYESAVFIGIHGANMTNILFMTPGTDAIEMMSNTYVNPSYLSMANSIGVRYSLVPSTQGSPPDVERGYADITADLSLVEQVVGPMCVSE